MKPGCDGPVTMPSSPPVADVMCGNPVRPRTAVAPVGRDRVFKSVMSCPFPRARDRPLQMGLSVERNNVSPDKKRVSVAIAFVINDVETLAAIHEIRSNGGELLEGGSSLDAAA